MNLLTHFSDECQELFAHSPVPLMLIKESGGTILEANAAALQLFECESLNVLGKTTIDLGIWTQPNERSRLMHVMARAGYIDKRTVHMRTVKGRSLYIALSIRTVTLSQIRCFAMTCVDITWQEQLAAKLRSNRDLSDLAQAGTSACTWHFDRASRCVYFSENGHALLDPATTHDPLQGVPVETVIHPDDLEHFFASTELPPSDAVTLDIPVRLRTGGGHYRWFRLWCNQTGGPGGLADIHNYKVLEIARLREARKASLAASAAGMGTWETFPDGTSVWDPQVYRLYGHDPGTPLLPQDIFRTAQTPSGYARTSRWLAKCLKHGLSLSIEFEIRWPDGQVRWLASQGGYSEASDTVGPSLLGVGWDITEQRRAQSTLQKQQQELSSLTAQLLEQEKLTTSKLALALHDQLGQSLTAARLLLDHQMNVQPTDTGHKMGLILGQAMEQVRSLLMDLRPPMLEENGLGPALQNEIERVHPDSSLCDITLDASDHFMTTRWAAEVEYAFFMIAREAISNALAHAKPNLIQVLLRQEEHGLTMEIVDDGQGFSPESGGARPGHLGLVGMKERAAAVNARLSFTSLLGDGTRVKLMWAASL